MNMTQMISSYNRSQKRKSALSSDDSLMSASELSEEWGLSYIATCEEIKRLRIPLAFNIANEKFYDRETCNKKMPFLSECKIIQSEKKEVECVDKNEELQRWLNDDRYVRRVDLQDLWGIPKKNTNDLLQKENIKVVKSLYFPDIGQVCFYNKKECEHAYADSHAKKQKQRYDKNEELQKWLNNTKYIQVKELKILWGFSNASTYRYLHLNKIRPIKRIGLGLRKGCCVFYDRAECERARPFINQPEKKEVEKVETIGELATATKYQILSESGADDFVWDKVTMKNKIMPVKNYCDERGKFVSLFKKDETVSAILEYKKEQKQLLDNCLADKNLVTTKELVNLWKIDRSAVHNNIYRLKIKPYAKIKLDNGSLWYFYKKSDCIESQEVEKVEEKQIELPEPKEQSPDIIPADTIDLFTTSELESELKQRGIELTTEVRAKINASDMPEMQHIATMIRGNAKTIAIRLSVLNDIAIQLTENRMLNLLTATEAMNYLNENLCQNAYEEKTFKHVQSFLSYALCGTPKFAELYPYQEGTVKVPAMWVKRQLVDYCNQNQHNHCLCGGKETKTSNVGRKNKYKTDFPDLVANYARQGATDKSICEYLGISTDTFYQYIKKYPDMAKALLDGRNANPLAGINIVGKSSSERYLMQMQMQINDMQKTIESIFSLLQKKDSHKTQKITDMPNYYMPKIDEQEILARFKSFMSKYKDSRFSLSHGLTMQKRENRAGFILNKNGNTYYFLLPKVLKQEIFADVNSIEAVRILIKSGLIVAGSAKPTHQVKINSENRALYLLSSSLWNEQE